MFRLLLKKEKRKKGKNQTTPISPKDLVTKLVKVLERRTIPPKLKHQVPTRPIYWLGGTWEAIQAPNAVGFLVWMNTVPGPTMH